MKQLLFTPGKYILTLALAYAPMLFFNAGAQSTAKASTKRYNLSGNQLAIQGYDPVAYFTDNTAKEGKKEFSYVYDGVTYRFATAQHLQLFKSGPGKYQPQYGGWCAYAMGATGEKVDVDPGTFKLVDGKLYLFYNRFFNNTKKSWDKDEAALKQKADANWQKINH